jgi:hypothetical protein
MIESRRFRTWGSVAVVTAAVAAALVAVRPALRAQGVEEQELSVETLQRDIRFLGMLSTLGMTGEQRAKAAQAIETFRQKREAVEKLAQPPELLSALKAMRDTLLAGKPPTDAQREAAEAARPPDDGTLDKAFMDARAEVLAALEAILTDAQKEQLDILPLLDTADEVIGMCMQSRQADAQEAQEMRLHAFPEIREQLALAAGDDAQKALNDFQSLINRVAALTPEQVEPQRQQLVGQIVTLLKSTFDKDPEMAAERLQDQLWGWATEPRVGELLKESADGMGPQ